MVLNDINIDIIALQEIENQQAFNSLIKRKVINIKIVNLNIVFKLYIIFTFNVMNLIMIKRYIVDSTCNEMRLDRWLRFKIGKIPQGLIVPM